MKITFGSTVILDTAANGLAVTGFRRNGDAVIQDVQLYRAASNSFVDRGNRRTEMSWEVTRQFATQQLAEDFVLTHDTALAGNQDAAILEADGATTRYLRGAVCKAQTSFLGAYTTKTSYQLRGGLVTNL